MKKKPTCYYDRKLKGLQRSIKDQAHSIAQLQQDVELMQQKEKSLHICLQQMSSSLTAMKELVLPPGSQEVQRQIDTMTVALLLEKMQQQDQTATAEDTGTPCSSLVQQLRHQSAVTSSVTALGHAASSAAQQLNRMRLALASSADFLQQQQQSPPQQQQQRQCKQIAKDCSNQQQFFQEGRNVSYVLTELELHIQTALFRGRCRKPGVTSELYTTTITNQLMQDRQRLAKLSALSTQQLLASRRDAVKQFGFLLPRCDSESADAGSRHAEQQIDQLVDAQSGLTLAQELTGKLLLNTEVLMTNMVSGEQEMYPEGWWKQVVKMLCLTKEQTTALRWLWAFSKPEIEDILKQYQQLSVQLAQMLQQRIQTYQQFEVLSHQAFCNDVVQQPSPGQLRDSSEQQRQITAPRAAAAAAVSAPQPPSTVVKTTPGTLPVFDLNCVSSLLLQSGLQGGSSLPVGAAQTAAAASVTGGYVATAAAAAAPICGNAVVEAGAKNQAGAFGRIAGQNAEPGFSPRIWNLSNLCASVSQIGLTQQQPVQIPAVMAGYHLPCGSSDSQVALQRQRVLVQPSDIAPGQEALHKLGTGPSSVCRQKAAVTDQLRSVGDTWYWSNISSVTVTDLLLSDADLWSEPWSSEQQEVEEQMNDLMHKLSVLLFMLEMQLMNVLSKKQLALAALHSYPYCLDAFSVCQALDDLDWPTDDVIVSQQERTKPAKKRRGSHV